MSLKDRFEFLLTCPDKFETLDTEHLIVDTRDHLPLLRTVAKGNILEIGVHTGNSTLALLLGVEEKGGHVYSIDINSKCGEVLRHPQWTFIAGDSRDPEVLKLLKNTLFDVVYIDGDHSYEGARHDLLCYGGMAKQSGLILVHDVEHPEFPGVRKAFEEYEAINKYVQYGSWGLGVIEV